MIGLPQAKALLKGSVPPDICPLRCASADVASSARAPGPQAQLDLEELAQSAASPQDSVSVVTDAVNTGDLVPQSMLGSDGDGSESSEDEEEEGVGVLEDEESTAALSELAGALETSMEEEEEVRAETPRRRNVARTVSRGLRVATGWLLDDLASSRDAALRGAAQVRRATIAAASPTTSPRARQHLARAGGQKREHEHVTV